MDGGLDDGQGGSAGSVPDGSEGVKYTFDAPGIYGWHYTPWGSTPVSGNPPGDPSNIANRSSPLVWDSSDADGKIDASGSLKASVPFSTDSERVDIQAFSTGTTVRDWTGYIITAQVKLVSGGNVNPNCPMQAWLYVSSSPQYDTRLSATVDLVTGSWVTLTFDMADATIATYLINQMGVQVTTGAPCVPKERPFDTEGGTDADPDANPDVSVPSDSGADAGATEAATEAGPADGGSSDAAAEGSAPDGGAPDASASDAGPADAGPADASASDAGPADAGPADAGAPDNYVGPQATRAIILIDNVIVSVKQ
jgi:hypothetical protein